MATSVIFWNLESGNLEIWKLPGIGWFWPISMYWVFFPLSFCHWTWFCAQKFKIPVFQNFFQKFSGNRENLWNLLFWTSSNILGIISTQFWSLKSILSSEFQNYSFPEIFPEVFSKSGNFLEIWKFSGNLEILWNLLFWPFPTYWIWSLNQFLFYNFEILVFLKIFQNFSGSLEICCLGPIFNILDIIPTQFRSLSMIMHSEFIKIVFLLFFWNFSGNLEILSSFLFWANFKFSSLLMSGILSSILHLEFQFKLHDFP